MIYMQYGRIIYGHSKEVMNTPVRLPITHKHIIMGGFTVLQVYMNVKYEFLWLKANGHC